MFNLRVEEEDEENDDAVDSGVQLGAVGSGDGAAEESQSSGIYLFLSLLPSDWLFLWWITHCFF